MKDAERDAKGRSRPAEPPFLLAAALLVGLLVGGATLACDAPSRPSAAEWRQAWSAERARLPDADELTGPGAEEACERLLVSTRKAHGRLLPSPDEVLDHAVEDWILYAGGLAFDCPGAEGDPAAVRTAMRSLDEIAAEIEAALDVEGPPPGAEGADR